MGSSHRISHRLPLRLHCSSSKGNPTTAEPGPAPEPQAEPSPFAHFILALNRGTVAVLQPHRCAHEGSMKCVPSDQAKSTEKCKCAPSSFSLH